MKVEKLFASLLLEFTNPKYEADILRARQEYQQLTGIMKDDFPIYLEKLDQFIDWYILEYELLDIELSPLEYYYQKNISNLKTDEVDAILSLKNTLFSLFKIVKNKHKLHFKDLVKGDEYIINNAHDYSLVLQKGDIVTARIYKHKNSYLVMKGILAHPEQSFRYIEKKIAYLRYLDRDYINTFIMRLSLMRLKIEEYSYLNVKEIYTDKPKINF